MLIDTLTQYFADDTVEVTEETNIIIKVFLLGWLHV